MAGLGVGLLIVAGGFSWWKFGSAWNVRRVWSAGTLTILDQHTDLGTLPASGVFFFNIALRNDAAKPLTIVGAKSACKCMAADKLPATIAVGATHKLRMALRLDGAKAADIPVVVYTEDGQAHQASVEFAIEPAKPNESVPKSPAPAGGISPVAAGTTP